MAQTAVQGFRLSPQQRRLWVLAREAEGSPYRAEATVRIAGPLDHARLEAALGEVVARHEILRTVFPVPPGMSRPAQVIQPPESVRLAAGPSGSFHPDREPPFAAALIPQGPESHHLLLAAHAFVADAAALEVIVRDLARAYAGRLDDEPPAQYADVAEALNELLESDETEAGRDFWREEGALPAERDSAPFCPQWISPGLETSARGAAVLLAAWRTVLWRLGMDGEAIGVEFPGRHYEGFDTAAGPFARFLPVRLPVAGGLSFAELVERTGGKLAELEEWQDYFFPEGGFLPAGFRFAEPADPEPAGPVRFEVESARGWTERFDLLLSATLQERGLALDLGYDSARFTEEEALRILAAVRALLENADPAARLGDLELTRPEERERLLRELAGPEVPIPPVAVHRLILEQAGRTPDAVALSGEDGIRVTYEELAARTRELAAHLRSLGVGPETRVGLCADRSPEMIVGLLAILEAGGAWVPLDPSYPAARLAFMLEDSKAPVLLIQEHLRDRIDASGVEVVLLNTPRVSTLGYPNTALEGGHEEAAAYVLYTSGSTGTPKGVVVRHRALTNQILWMLDAYPLEPGDRVLQKTPSSFDASVWEILAPLAAGAELVLAAPGAHRDPVAMGRTLAAREVTTLQVVPALLRLLLDGGHLEGCPSLARLFCGGEPLTEDLRERVHRLSDTIELINLYGPTETTVQVTSWVAERRASDHAVPAGRPVHNARLYLLDPWGRLVPAGMPGEIWIGGVSPARGYLDRPELTADSFRPDPFCGEPGARMYRSGDLGRLREDGALEFLGRLGGQNKVRGYRFDPGEIEAILRTHPAVRDAAVLVREDRLVAYAVPGEGTPSLAALRPFLAERLPDYLVPTDLVVLPAFPLSPSGKVDRSVLPAPEEEERPAEVGSAAPRTPLEEILAEIWAGLLGREWVGVHDNFFELGGHSLLGAQLVARVRDALGVEISLRNIFEAPTVAGLAARVEEAWHGEGPAAPPLVPVPRVPGEGLPLSFAQQRLWFLDRLAPGSAYYNVPSAVRFTGDLDERALGEAFNEIVRVHETLRTTFRAVDGRPVQTAAPSLVLPMPVADLSGLPAAWRETEARRLAREEAQRPFDLATGPLARLTLLRLGGGERVLLTTLHHIVSDAWSVGVLYRSLLTLYATFASGKPSPLDPPPVQYADYAVWQRERFAGEAWERELAWWAGRLADLPVLRLPADRPRPPRQTFRGAGVSAELPGELAARLRSLARERGATLFMVLLAGFQALLHRITGQEEVILGSPVANRDRSEVEELIGFFVNTLVLRTDVSGNPPFAELVARARETALGAWAHQSLPFERLVEELQPERDLSRQPLFQVMFHLQNVPLPDFGLPGVTVEPLDVDPGTAPFDLGVDLLEISGGLLLVARYATDLFDRTTLLRLVDRYTRLLEEVAADPDRRLGELSLLSEPERHQLLAEWNDTETAVEPVPVHRLLAGRDPETVAVVFEDEALTYGELDERVRNLAGRLRAQGVRPGVTVGVRIERSPEMAVAVLAVFEAGGVFVPLDPDAPPVRQRLIEEDAFREGGVLLAPPPAPALTSPALLSHHADPLPGRGGSWNDFAVSPLPGRGNGVVGEGPGVRAGRGETSPAYVLFTSGTSGRPKGVLVDHGSLSNLLQVSRETWSFNPGDRMAVLAAETFDIFLWELLLPLVSGGTAVLFPRKPAVDVGRVVAALPGLTRLHAVPALLREIVERVRAGAGTVPGLRTVFVGGDRVPDELVTDLREVFPGADIVVLYGPTEGTILATSHRATGRSLLGRPLGNVRVTVRDRAGHPAPIGVPGEIVLGGAGVARGYLHRVDLTRERFAERDGERTYRTGDLGRWLADGPLEFLGRLDQQTKVRGVRVEPGEIEAVLLSHPVVREAAVVAREDVPGEPRLVAYAVCDPEEGSGIEREQVERWRAVYDTDVFGRRPEDLADPTFNTSGWNESATGAPISEAEMREWVDGTVLRILERLEGDRVLEIGCGTGLLLFRLAPRCLAYVASDFSAAALGYVEDVLASRPELAGRVTLHQALADDLSWGEPRSFDAVILNSVVQYFPSAGYLARVLEAAAGAVRPGGFVFVGDVRHASVGTRGADEPELVIDPALFAALPGRLPRISHVEVQLRRGRTHNELTRFRYDAILHVKRAESLPERSRVHGVPNARLAAVGEDPETFWALAEDSPWDVAVTWTPGDPAAFDVLLAPKREDGRPFLPIDPVPSSEPWERFTNRPLARRFAGETVPRLRAFLAERLPEAMVPSALVLLDHLPRTSHGKVDQSALPAPERARPDLGEAIVAPRTPAEEILAGLWAEVLGLDRVGVTDDFFALGGHSLLATQVVSRIRQAFGVEVELRALFEAPTVAGLAARIEAAAGPAAPPLIPRTWEGPERPLSFAQGRLWFLDRLEPGRATYNMPSALRVRGPLALPALAAAFDEISRRHEVLRERIVPAGDGPVALVDPPAPRPLPVVDLSALPAPVREPEARRLVLEEARRPFDLETGPLFRTAVLRLREREHAVLWTIHHAVSDGWSEGVLVAEVAALYAGNLLPPLPVRYADFALWQGERLQGGELEARLSWWRERLAGAPTRLDLPTDRPRPAVASGKGRRFTFQLSGPVAEAVRGLCRREGVTPFMALLAAFATLLGRLARQEDLLVGTPVAGRRHAEVEGLIGFFVDTLALRADLSGDPTGGELLARVRETALGAWAHQDLPFERLVEELAPERDLGRQPLIQAVLQLQNVPAPAVRLPGLVAEPLEIDPGVAPFDLGLDLLEIPGGIAGSLRYATDLFDETTVRRMVGAYEWILASLAGDPGKPIAGIPLVSEAERHQLLAEWNDTAVQVEKVPVHRLVAARAAERPEAVAVVFEGETLTYGELVDRAGRLARRLRAQGVERGTPVGLRMERSPEMAVAVLAIFEAGGVFVPLDPNAPPVRLQQIEEDAFREGGVLLTSPPTPALTSPALLSHHADPRPGRGGSWNDFAVSPLPGRGKGVVGEGPGVRAGWGNVPDSTAPVYLIYTSGTSGRPKGVLIEHGSLSNLLEVSRAKWAWDAADRMPCLAAETFDVFLWELLLPLVSGGSAVLVPRRPAPDVDRLVESLPGFTRLHAVPALLREIVDRIRPGAVPGLRTVFVGGDRVPDALLRDAREAFPGAEIAVLYGPTEGTILGSSFSVPPGEERGLLGRPLGNVSIRVQEPSGLPAPVDVPGEIVLGGAGVARGYFHLEEQTRERFGEIDGERIYRTGDLGRWLPDGTLEFLGRLDQQVKVRGVRVEPGEVEAALLAHPAVRQAAVLAREDRGGVRLEAWIAVDGPAPDLRPFLRERLPEALIPSVFGVLPELPLTSHGKVDRAALARQSPAAPERAYVPPRTPVEEVLAGIWSAVLKVDRVGAEDDFFALSGHSLLATQVAWRIRESFGVDLPLRRLFERATLAELAAEIEAASGASPVPPVEPAPRDRPLPATLNQAWVYRAQGGPVSSMYNLPSAFRLRGPFDPGAMSAALSEIVRRHEALRSRLVEKDGALFQEPLPPAAFPLPLADLAALAEESREEELLRRAREEAGRPFDVRRAPLIRALAVRLDGEDHALLVTMHHAVSDGWSIEVFKRDLAALYAAFSRRLPSPLADLPVQYADFALWQRGLLASDGLDEQLAWWKRQLADLPEPLSLPGDRPRLGAVSLRPVGAAFAVPEDVARELRSLARESGSTLGMVLTAGLFAWIREATGREEFTLASIFSGRTRPELEPVMGFFMNTVVLRADLSGEPTFRELLARVRETVLAAYAHQDVPFPRVFAELFPGKADRARLVRVAFNLLGFLPGTPEPSVESGGLSVDTFSVQEGHALYDLALFCRDGGDAVYCQLIGAADLFDPETIERIGREFVRRLARAAAAPDAP